MPELAQGRGALGAGEGAGRAQGGARGLRRDFPKRRALRPRGSRPRRVQVGSCGDRRGPLSSRGRAGGRWSRPAPYVHSSLLLGFWDWPPPSGPRLASLWVALFWGGRRTVGPPCAGELAAALSRPRALTPGAAGSSSRPRAPGGAQSATRRWKLGLKNERVERVLFSERRFGQRMQLAVTDGLDGVRAATYTRAHTRAHAHARTSVSRALGRQRMPWTHRAPGHRPPPRGRGPRLSRPARGRRPKVGPGRPQVPPAEWWRGRGASSLLLRNRSRSQSPASPYEAARGPGASRPCFPGLSRPP